MPRRQPEPAADREQRRQEYLEIRAQIGTKRIIEILGIAKQTAKIFATKSLDRVITKRDLKRLKEAVAASTVD